MIVAVGGPGSSLYKFIYLLHILTIIVAFAPAAAHPLLVAQSTGSPARPALLGYLYRNTNRVYGPALVAVGLVGIALILVSDGVWAFSQGWVTGAFVVWIAMNGVLHGLLRPAEGRLAGGDEGALRRVELGGQLLTVLLLVMLVLMIWKPGR